LSPNLNGSAPGREARAGRFPGPSLIPALTAIQREHGWLPREELVALSRQAKRPLYEIEGLISFYPHFRTSPPARLEVAVCHDLSCWLNDADAALAAIRAAHGDDAAIELREVSCLGRCELAPAISVNEVPAPASALENLLVSRPAAEVPGPSSGPGAARWPNDPYDAGEERYRVLRRALFGELSASEILGEIREAGLRGMGGAGFPAAQKWQLVADQAAEPKYVICNADESEPGTFKDRQILADQPHLVLEGLLLGMVVTGAEQGWVFIRHEYGREEAILRAELERIRAEGLIGVDALGTGRRLEVEVFTSPGGYILGEESALLECLEGHRGEPRNKPPFPGSSGLWGRPTLINNVETFADTPIIVERGATWWREQGVNGASGWKFFAVSGHVERPGVYCVPLGTTIGDLLKKAGGVRDGAPLGAVQPGGASSNFLSAERLDVPLDFEAVARAGSMLGSGALVVVAEGTDLLAAATNILRFFRNESCGKCVPCRVGSAKAHTILTASLREGRVQGELDGQVAELEETMRLTSICGLGQVALGPVASVARLERGSQPA
jgi:formate dehydrogenase beta subunit